MKKFLLALAAVALTAGSATAQESIIPGEVTRGSLNAGAPRTRASTSPCPTTASS
jgi:hypothetical protein